MELPDRCVPCEGGVPALSRAVAEAHMADLTGWELDYPRIRRRLELAHFRAALVLVNRIGMLAEEQGHHPDMHLTGWNKLEIVLWTHAIDGLSVNDFVLARKIEELIES